MDERRTITRRGVTAGLIATAAAPRAAWSQTAGFPSQPVRIVVPFAAGGPGDLVARVIGEKVGADLGQSVIVENRSGANGVIGVQAVTRARPDGHTLLQISAANVIVPLLQANSYDWERELLPVFGLGSVPYAIAVQGRSGIRSIAELPAAATATPGGLSYGSGGAGSPSHLAPARLAGELRMNATHVPYRGLAGAVQALLAGQVHFICATVVDLTQLARSGDVRLLAVTSNRRLPALPDVPTMTELGFADFLPATWYAYMAPAGTPPAILDRLQAAFTKAAADPALQDQLGRAGLNIQPRSGAELTRFMRDDAASWRRVIQENQIRIDN